jgi:signal peptidase I
VPVRRLNGREFHDLAGQILQSGHLLRFQASGSSMQPFIHDGDILEVAPLSGKHVRSGEVLLVEAVNGDWLAHRVVKTRNRDGRLAILIKGDACSYPDGWFGLDDILGRVVTVQRDSQRIQLTSIAERRRAKMWVAIAPWIRRLSWLPQRLRQYVWRLLFRSGLPD